MKEISISTYSSPAGKLVIGIFEEKLVLCDWVFRKMRGQIDQRIQTGLNAKFVESRHPLMNELEHQLEAYFSGNLREFQIPMQPVGTQFQVEVWNQLCKIPYGQTQSYLQLSQELGNPDAIRAVAAANGANAISILIPCHRIIGSDGSLVGYAGGLEAKKKLLRLEGASANKNQQQTSLF